MQKSERAFGSSCSDVHAYMSVFPDDRIPWSGALEPAARPDAKNGSERGQQRANDVSARVNASSAIRRRRGRKEDRWMGQRHRGSVGTTATGTRCRVSRQGLGTRDGDGVVRCTETQTACVRRCRLAPTAPPPSAVGQGPSRRSWASSVQRAGRSSWGCGTKASTRPLATACSVDVIMVTVARAAGPVGIDILRIRAAVPLVR